MAPHKGRAKTKRKVGFDELTAKRITGVPCYFCSNRIDNELNYGNLYIIGDIVAHYFCVLLSAGSVQNGDDKEGLHGFLYSDIKKELDRSTKNRCSVCKHKGATLGCCEKACKKQYHVPCARTAGALCLFYGQFEVFCPVHARSQNIPEQVLLARNVGAEKHCQICFEDVGPSPSYDTFWPPCCGPEKDEWFHRPCLERMALSAGLYHLKCPLCNNKDVFNKAVQHFGYYIPDRDASWEQQDFYDDPTLYCHAPDCKDKNRDDDTGSWTLVVCVACGGEEVHEGCAVTLPHHCSTCREPTASMGLTPLPTIREIERGEVRVMTSHISLRRTMSAEVIRNCKLFMNRNRCLATAVKAELKESSSNHDSPSKVIREDLLSMMDGPKDVNVDELVAILRRRVDKPAPRCSKMRSIRKMVQLVIEKLRSNPQQSVADIIEAGPSGGSSPTATHPPTNADHVKKAFSPMKTRSSKSQQKSPILKYINLEKTLQRIRKSKARVNVVADLTERLGDVTTDDVIASGGNSDVTVDGSVMDQNASANPKCSGESLKISSVNSVEAQECTSDHSVEEKVAAESTEFILQSPQILQLSDKPDILISDNEDQEDSPITSTDKTTYKTSPNKRTDQPTKTSDEIVLKYYTSNKMVIKEEICTKDVDVENALNNKIAEKHATTQKVDEMEHSNNTVGNDSKKTDANNRKMRETQRKRNISQAIPNNLIENGDKSNEQAKCPKHPRRILVDTPTKEHFKLPPLIKINKTACVNSVPEDEITCGQTDLTEPYSKEHIHVEQDDCNISFESTAFSKELSTDMSKENIDNTNVTGRYNKRTTDEDNNESFDNHSVIDKNSSSSDCRNDLEYRKAFHTQLLKEQCLSNKKSSKNRRKNNLKLSIGNNKRRSIKTKVSLSDTSIQFRLKVKNNDLHVLIGGETRAKLKRRSRRSKKSCKEIRRDGKTRGSLEDESARDSIGDLMCLDDKRTDNMRQTLISNFFVKMTH